MPLSSPRLSRESAESTVTIGAARLAGLGNRFIALFGRRLTRHELATQIAILVADAIKARAVAVLGYDRRRERLVVLADHGLGDDSRAALGDENSCGWDIPLRALRNRRISVIEAAHQNPFVPRPLISLSPDGLSIASLPIYHQFEPVAVLLLLAATRRAFPDTQLQTLSQALRICARALDTPDGGTTFHSSPTPSAPGPVIGQTMEPGSDAEAPAAVIDPADHRHAQPALHLVAPRVAGSAQADPAVTSVTAEPDAAVARLQADLRAAAQAVWILSAAAGAMARERDHFAQQLSDAESTRLVDVTAWHSQMMEQQAQITALQAEREQVERRLEELSTRAHQSIDTLKGERDSALDRLRAGDVERAELHQQLTRLDSERKDVAYQVETLARELHSTQEALELAKAVPLRERAVIEADRDRWKEETSSLHVQLAQQAERVATFERELRDVRAAHAQTEQMLAETFQRMSDEQSAFEVQHAARSERLENEQRRAEALDAQCAHLRQALAASEGRRAGLEAAVAQADAQIAMLQDQATQAQQQHAALAEQLETSRRQHTELAAAAASKEAELERTLEAAASNGATEQQRIAIQISKLRDDLRASHNAAEVLEGRAALERASLEAERNRWRDEADTLRAEMARSALAIAGLRETAAHAEAAVEHATAEQDMFQRAIDTQRADWARIEHALRNEVAAAQSEKQRLCHETAALHARVAERDEQLTAAQVHLERLREESADRFALTRQTQLLSDRVLELERNLTTSRAECERAVQLRTAAAEELAGARQLQTEMQATADQARALMQTELEQLSNRCAQLETENTTLAAELQAQQALSLQAAATAARADSDQQWEEAEDHAQSAGPATIEQDTPLIIERSAPLDAVAQVDTPPDDAPQNADTGATISPEPESTPPPAELVLLDSGPLRDQAADALTGAGLEITLFAPTQDVVTELAERNVKCIMLNVGSGASAWRLLRNLRESVDIPPVPILAYAMGPEAALGCSLGRADFALWPIEPRHLIDRLNGVCHTRVRRLLAVGADVGEMNRLREPLADAGISISIALDEKHAVQLAPIVRPEAVIFHLSPTSGPVARAITAFRSAGPMCEVPLLILMDKTVAETEEEFFNATSRQLLSKGTFQFISLPAEIGRLIGEQAA